MTHALTPSAQLDAVRAAVIKANPDILKPHRGARIRRNRDGKEGFIVTDFFTVDFCTCCYLMYDNEAGYTHMAQYAEFTLPEGHQHYDMKLDVLGRPIRLADVLLAWEKNGISKSVDQSGKMVDVKFDGEHQRTELAWWNLRQDSLDQQSPETILFLASLLCT
jgi:hypothetical protein